MMNKRHFKHIFSFMRNGSRKGTASAKQSHLENINSRLPA